MYTAGLTWGTPPSLKYELYEKTFGVNLTLNQFGNKYNSYTDDIGIPKDYLDAPDESLKYKVGNFLFWLETYLDTRYQYQYEPLRGKDHEAVLREYGINIGKTELLYLHQPKIDWYEQRTANMTVAHSGYKCRTGDAMSFNTGSFNATKGNVGGFALLDRGTIILTDQRIIFIGNESRENRSIHLRDILEFEIFRDGVLLGKLNGRKPLIFFPEAINTLIQPDGLNPFVRVLYRLLLGTQHENLASE